MGRRDHFYDMINLQSLWNSDRFPIQLQVVSHELGDFKSLISRDVVENLCGSAGRPIYLQRRDSFCFCQPDRLLKWIASEAASRADVAIDRHGFFSSCSNLDPTLLIAARLVFLPMSFSVNQLFSCPGFWKRML